MHGQQDIKNNTVLLPFCYLLLYFRREFITL